MKGTLRGWLDRLERTTDPICRAQADHESFGDYASDITDRLSRVCCAVGIVGLILLWPLDLVVLAEHPRDLEIFAIGRALDVVGLAVGLLVIRWAGRLGVATTPLWYVHYLFFVAFNYHLAAMLGGPNEPWVHTALVIPIFTVALVVPLVPRILWTSVASTTAMVAYFATEPRHLDTPYVGSLLGSMVAATGVSVAAGHLVHGLARSSYTQARELQRLRSERAAATVAVRRPHVRLDLDDQTETLAADLPAL